MRFRRTKNSRKAVIAVDLGGTNLRAALVDGKGRILFRTFTPTHPSRSKANVTDQIISLVRSVSNEAKNQKCRVTGAGIGVPGFFSDHGRVIAHSPNFPGWKNFALAAALKKRLPFPCRVGNDANCATIGEAWRGAGKGLKHLVCLTIGTGVGGGIIANGELLTGSRGSAGEIGHMNIEPDGPRCGCGGNGCLEMLVSGTALKRQTGKNPERLALDAKNGNTAALKAFQKMGRRLGIAAASLAYLTDPDAVILSGQVSLAYPFFAKEMKREFLRRTKNHPARALKIVQGRLGDDAGLIGAARLVLGSSGA